MAVLTLRLDEQTDRKLRRLAKESERPKSYFIKKALELYLQEYEDYQIALARRADRDDDILTLAQVRKALGI
ncbi:Ribbon-helix-helix protein, CopG family [Nitrospira tepida]|uniref:Ribbon-helix-helix protein, CopG family n=1 Tax=Nitrospira tepida TaxID=2973512 RepID=A0AA86MX99_9BACT|nr:ribbon-helix-helix protein, CopG family [Nitrospira tepida]CAI4030765.1 Ribbon-helix-helix protein, CopG family [Nitrospira tepida]